MVQHGIKPPKFFLPNPVFSLHHFVVLPDQVLVQGDSKTQAGFYIVKYCTNQLLCNVNNYDLQAQDHVSFPPPLDCIL